MTARLIKESRSLWLIVLGGVIGLLACTVLGEGNDRLPMATMVLCLLCAVIGISSMGFEFLHGMHTNLFVQPVPREQSWRDKTIVQGVALVILAAVYSLIVRDVDVSLRSLSWALNQMAVGAVAPLFALGCGSLMVLAIRHVQGAFWLLIGSHFLLVTLVEAFYPLAWWEWRWVGHVVVFAMVSVVGLALGRRQYLAFQNYSVLDQMVSLVGGGKRVDGGSSIRRGVWLTLVRKELHLQWLNLAVFVTAYLCGVLWGVFRTWTGWALMKDFVCLGLPIFIGAAAIAEERRQEVHKWQLTLPPIRRVQWQVKLLVSVALAMLLGVTLYGGSVLLLPRESEYGILGAVSVPAYAAYVLWATVIGVFASSMARHYVQAAAVVCCLLLVGLVIDQVGARWLIGQYGSVPCRNLFRLLGIAVFPVLFLTLAYGNFGSTFPEFALMKRSALGVVMGLSGVLLVTAVLYHRTWELFERERLNSVAVPPDEAAEVLKDLVGGMVIDREGGLLSVRWKLSMNRRHSRRAVPAFSRVGSESDWARVVPRTGYPGYAHGVLKSNGTLWVMAGPRYAEIRGWSNSKLEELPSNLRESTPGFRWRDVDWRGAHWWGVREDGTLWEWGWRRISRPEDRDEQYEFIDQPRQVGADADWVKVAGDHALKQDGSFWEWGWGNAGRRERHSEPEPVSALAGIKVTDFRRTYSGAYVKTEDGTVFCYSRRDMDDEPMISFTSAVPDREQLYRLNDEVNWQQPLWNYVKHRDGSLWLYYDQDERVPLGKHRRRMDGSDAWLALQPSNYNVWVGMKRDGSLWSWHEGGSWNRRNKTFYEAEGLTLAPDRLIPRRFRPVKIGMLDPKLWR